MRYAPLVFATLLAMAAAPAAATGAASPSQLCCRARSTSSHASRVRTTTYHAPRVRAPSASYHASRPPRMRVTRYHAPRALRPTCCRSRSPSYHAPRRRSTATHTPRTRRTATVTTSGRNSRGRIIRSESAKRSFERSTGYAGGRKGYVVDHVTPLACGGTDAPSNMQWQTAADGKAKDKWERKGCTRSH